MSESGQPEVTILSDETGGVPLRLATRPGFPGWEGISQAEELLAASAEVQPGERVLVCPCGHGALGVWAAAQTEPRRVACLDTNSVAVSMARRTMVLNGREAARVEATLPARLTEPYDVALLALPKGRDFARLLFLSCYQALREGGRLYLAGPNRGGIKSSIHDAEDLFGPSETLAYKGGNRVARLIKREPTRSIGDLSPAYRVPGLAENTYHAFEVDLDGETYAVRARPGVFSWRELDSGTRALLDALDVRATDRVADVGCGYGILGAYAARHAPSGEVTMIDVDLLAVESTRATLAANGIHGAEVLLGDGLAAVPGRTFTLVISNPPFHSGHSVNRRVAETLVQEAFAGLEPRGRLVLVANRFLPYDKLMEETFGAVETLVQTTQYHVLSATKLYKRKARGRPSRAQRRDQLEAEDTIWQIED